MVGRKISLVAVWIVLAFIFGSVSEAGQAMIDPESVPVYQPKFYPFETGEKAVYRTSWNVLKSAATAEIYTSSAIVNGKKVYQVRVEAKSSKVLDLIWKMRDTISSTFDSNGLSPLHYTFNQKENSRVINTDARLDPVPKRWAVNR